MTVTIENEYTQDIIINYSHIIREVIATAIDYVNCPYECEVNVLITDNSYIQNVNKQYRSIDAPTDVLSFPMIDFKQPEDFSIVEASPVDYFNSETGELLLGDIILSYDKILAQAEEYGHSLERELAFLVAHSILHLSGYDHIEDADRKIMEIKQEEILIQKGYTRD